MLGKNTLNKTRIKLGEEAYQQYEIVGKELNKLCKLSGAGFDFCGSELFDKVRRVCFKEGVVAGVTLTGVCVIGYGLAKHKLNKSKEEES